MAPLSRAIGAGRAFRAIIRGIDTRDHGYRDTIDGR